MRFCFLLGLAATFAAVRPLAAQTAPTPADSADAAASPGRLLVKVGLAPGRLLPQSGYYGFQARVSPSLGLEYRLSPRFTLAGEVEADFTFPRQPLFYNDLRRSLVPSAGTGLMLRYYYNQAGRARRNRAHGPFVGNYLALGTNTELEQRLAGYYDIANPNRFDYKRRYLFDTSLNLYWGMQRRLGRHFLYDLNAGAGVGTRYFSGLDGQGRLRFEPNLDLNLRIYFVH